MPNVVMYMGGTPMAKKMKMKNTKDDKMYKCL